MSELRPLRPLIETTSNDFELALLRSVERDEPSPLTVTRAATRIGIGAVVLTSALEAGAAKGAGAALAGSGARWLLVLKSLAIGVASGLVVSATSHALLSRAEPRTQAVAAATTARGPNARGAVTARDASAPNAAMTAATPAARFDAATAESVAAAERDGAPGAPRPTPARAATSGAPNSAAVSAVSAREREVPAVAAVNGATPAPPASAFPSEPISAAASGASGNDGDAAHRPAEARVSIAEETANIDRARQALLRGNAGDALSELERYRLRWPNGVFATEATLLHVEAKLRLGERASAERGACLHRARAGEPLREPFARVARYFRGRVIEAPSG